jgi:hypothetical protein
VYYWAYVFGIEIAGSDSECMFILAATTSFPKGEVGFLNDILLSLTVS